MNNLKEAVRNAVERTPVQESEIKAIKDSSAPAIDNHSSVDLIEFSHDDLAHEIGINFFYQNARYVRALDCWYIWNGERWLIDERYQHMTHIGHGLRQKAENIINWVNDQKDSYSDGDKEYDRLVKYIKNERKTLKSAPLRLNIESILKVDTRIAVGHETFDSNIDVIGTKNETINLKTGKLSKPNRDDHISKLTGCTVSKQQPVLWLKFLNEIFKNDQTIISFLQRLCGYILTGRTNEECLFFFYGNGANGKSNFLETVFFILGDYARRAPSTLFLEQRNEQHPTSLAGLRGSRLVIGSELPKGKAWNEEIIKDLTGGDTLTARLMRQDFFEFKPQFTLMIAGNHQPRIKSTDNGIRRRMVMVPFKVSIPKSKRDKSLKQKLINEAPEILNWMIHGAVTYFEIGLNVPDAVIDASAEYIKNEDTLGECLESIVVQSSNGKAEFHSLFVRYTSWMEEQGFNFKLTEHQLRKEIKERGLNITRGYKNLYHLNGYQLIEVCKSGGSEYQKAKWG